MTRTRRKKAVAAALVLGVLVVAAARTAFTASNTVPANVVGLGSATVSGATATSVNYDLDATQLKIDQVNFVISPAIPLFSVAQVRLTKLDPEDYDSGWLACANSGTAVACDVSTQNILVADVENVSLVVH